MQTSYNTNPELNPQNKKALYNLKAEKLFFKKTATRLDLWEILWSR